LGHYFGKPYTVEEKAHRKVVYANKETLEENIVRKHAACLMMEDEAGEGPEPPMGTGVLHTPVTEQAETTAKRRSHLRT